MAPTHPELLWAQRSSETDPERNIIYLTINAPELDPSYTLSVDGNKLKFEGQSREVASKGTATTLDAKDYAFDLELFDEVEEARRGLTGKGVQVVLKKKKAQEEYWPRLLKEKGKNSRIQTDWSKWVDEDEQDEAAAADDDFGMGGGGMPDMGALGGMGGMPGMGGMGGGAGGMDFASMMGGGAGGAGGMDFAKMMEQMKAAGIGGGEEGLGGAEGGEDSSDDEGPPPLEEA
ncbi:p23 chaperone protein wos2 [Rhodotorula toruloides]